MSGFDTVELTLGDKTYVLTPTFKVAERISQRFGGYLKAMESVTALDINAMVQIIQAGTPKITDAEVKELPRRLYEAKLPTAMAPIIDFLAIVANNGKRPPAPADDPSGNGETGETGEG